MKVIIAGTQEATYDDVRNAMALCPFRDLITSVASGKAQGADTFGEAWAKERKITVYDYPAKWSDITAPGAIVAKRKNGSKWNKRAGFDRNQKMVDNNDALIAVWDGSSPGTADTISRAIRKGLLVFVYNYTTGEVVHPEGERVK